MPDHRFYQLVEDSGVPLVTTSVNLSGEPYMIKLEDVSEEILNKVDYVIYEGEKAGTPSIKIDLS